MKHPRRREATPIAHMILSKRMADHKAHDMLCELVDDALDAEAKRVSIELGRRGVTVADDGSGIEDIMADCYGFSWRGRGQDLIETSARFGWGISRAC